MVARIRRRSVPDIWPGFVDAISTLLIIIIFLLMIFTLAQFFLSEVLSGRNAALERLNRQVAELSDLLALERATNADLRNDLSQLSSQIQIMSAAREAMTAEIEALGNQRDELRGALDAALARTAAAEQSLAEAQKTIETDREALKVQLGTIESLNRDIAALRKVREELEKRVTDLAASLEENRRSLTAARDRTKALEADLASEKERTALAQKEIAARDLRLEKLTADSKAALDSEREISSRANEQVELLNRQIAAMRQQLARLSAALEVSEAKAREQNIQIVDLGKRLNAALANKVAELARYRSEFFGKLREALGDAKGVRIEGDRFVFQSEVLFDSASADLRGEGLSQIRQLAQTLTEISARIPSDIDWVLRVDGHTDVRPIRTAQFPSNWELSSARSISVVKQLIAAGLPPRRLVAAGFGAEHPLDPRTTPEALARNRRIEFKLTNR
tara:strand:- start:637 stop:1986 length:1350 start_codon:yes stop_codon:yes gene_type:complete